MRRYTAKEREDAAIVAQMVASSVVREDDYDYADISQCARSIGASDKSADLASLAYGAVPPVEDRLTCDPREWAEAEAWLRSGWSPDDTWTAADRRRAGLEVSK